jgi:flagellar capping protein FliD
MGISTQADGSLTMNTINFQAAMTNDLAAAVSLFTFSGTSDNQVVTVRGGTGTTPTGPVSFVITKDAITNLLTGTLTNSKGTTGPLAVTNGVLTGTGDFVGLTLNVTGAGTGNLNLTRGGGQSAADLIASFTGVSGGIASIKNSITLQDKSLDMQITSGQSRLDSETASLKKKFAAMEATVGQMRASAASLSGA